MASKRQIKVDPKSLGEMTVSMLRGEHGHQRKEIAKLLDWLKSEQRFDVINLPYTLLLGLAEPLRRSLGVPICCTLQGEDLFLDNLGEPYRRQAMDLIRDASQHVDAFLPVSRYYYDYMPGYLGVTAEKMRLVPLGINLEGYGPRPPRKPGPFTIGYLARIAPEKGLHALADAYRRLRARAGLGPSRLVAAGYLAPEHHAYLEGIVSDLRTWGLADEFEYRGEVNRAQKIEFLHGLDVFSVPATYEEPKGLFLLEAMAAGVPVVCTDADGNRDFCRDGINCLIPEPTPREVRDALARVLDDAALRDRLVEAGRRTAREYDWNRRVDDLERFYTTLARR
jgi:glycosyltransferase involved in cell wall biosynthesis